MIKPIEIVEGRMGGEPCLYGHRLTVEQLIKYIFDGMTVEEYCMDFNVDKKLVLEALQEVEDNIGEWIKKDGKY